MLIYICYKESWYVAVCLFRPCVCVCVCVWVPIWSRLYINLAKYGHGPPEDDFKGDRNM